jgi:hypothetical protein
MLVPNTFPVYVDNFSHSSMVLQPFFGPWLLQFRNHIYTDVRNPWMSNLNTGQYRQRESAHTDIHALIGIRTHDPSVWASEDSSCLRPRCQCDRMYLDSTCVKSRGNCVKTLEVQNWKTDVTRRKDYRIQFVGIWLYCHSTFVELSLSLTRSLILRGAVRW